MNERLNEYFWEDTGLISIGWLVDPETTESTAS